MARILVSFILLPLIAAAGSVQPNVVKSLPGYDGTLDDVFAGHVPIDDAGERQLFYWLFGSRSASANTDPVVVWFQGGGGASPPWGTQTGPFAFGAFAGGGPSTFGLFNELGPFLPPDNSTGRWVLQRNPNSWGDRATLLFIDQPVGVGLSYFARPDGYAADMGAVGADAHAALRRILLELHPQYGERPLYLFGESYAGHYVPSIAHHILTHQDEEGIATAAGGAGGTNGNGNGTLNLVGLGLGDVCPGEENTMALPELLHGLGYVDDAQHTQMSALRSRCLRDLAAGRTAPDGRGLGAAFKSCEGIEIAKNLMTGGIHDQDSRRYADYPSLGDLVNVDAATQEDRKAFLTNVWLDLPGVRAALNVASGPNRSLVRDGNQPNTTRGMWIGNDNVRTTLPLWPRLVSSLKVMVYNGNFDVSCNHLGTERSMSRLSHFGDAEGMWARGTSSSAYRDAYGAMERRWFTIGGKMAGYWRHVELPSGSLLLVVGQGGGHLYPHDQPARMHTLLDRFLHDTNRTDASALCDEPRGFCRASDVAASKLGGRCALLYNCSGHGTCTDEAACRCEHGYSGADCSSATQRLGGASPSASATVAPGGWQMFSLDEAHRVRVHVNTSGAKLCVVTHGALPTPDSCNASWGLPVAAELSLDLGAVLAPFFGDAAAPPPSSFPWTLGVWNTVSLSDAANVAATVTLSA